MYFRFLSFLLNSFCSSLSEEIWRTRNKPLKINLFYNHITIKKISKTQTAWIIKAVLPSLSCRAAWVAQSPTHPQSLRACQEPMLLSRELTCPSALPQLQIPGRKAPMSAMYQHKPLPCFLSTSNPVPNYRQTAVRLVWTVDSIHMLNGLCALSRQRWSISIYMQFSHGTAAEYSNAASDINKAGPNSFYRVMFSSPGVCTCVVLQSLWPGSLLHRGS